MDHTGKLPANARIFIDYKKKKVFFDYPLYNKINSWKKFWAIYSSFLTLWIQLLLYLAGFYLLYLMLFTPLEATETITEFSYTNPLSHLIKIVINPLTYLAIIVLFAPPLLPTFLYYKYPKQLSRLIPNLYAWLSKKNYYRIRLNGKNNGFQNNNKIKIPLFLNIFLDYRTSLDYTKYIKSVAITELPLEKIRRNGRIKKQDRFWHCEFLFSKKPEKGVMEIDFL